MKNLNFTISDSVSNTEDFLHVWYICDGIKYSAREVLEMLSISKEIHVIIHKA